MYPYFKNVFADLVLRSAPNLKQNSKPSIDKVSLTEFSLLPGVLSDRLYTVLCQDNTEGRVYSDRFLKTMSLIYCSDLQQKMSFVFSLYDFDNDGYICAEDVRIVLSYIPLQRQDLQRSSMSLYESSTSLSQEEDDGPNSV